MIVSSWKGKDYIENSVSAEDQRPVYTHNDNECYLLTNMYLFYRKYNVWDGIIMYLKIWTCSSRDFG